MTKKLQFQPTPKGKDYWWMLYWSNGLDQWIIRGGTPDKDDALDWAIRPPMIFRAV